MSECTHDCSSCGENCSSREIQKLKPNEHSSIKKIYAVVSGKGGVGKSMVTSMLSVLTNRKGYKVGVMDADITGPSMCNEFGLTGKTSGCDFGIMPMTTPTGIEVISMNMFLNNPSDPVVWRGSMLNGVINQFFQDVFWGDLDYLYIDMPPGTGDIPLTVFQSLPIDGIIVVTSPQDLVSMIVEKAVKMAKLMNVPIVGLVQNLSYFECPNCKNKHFIFGEGKIEEVARNYEIDSISYLPIDPKLAESSDNGMMEWFQGDYLDSLIEKITK
ncbi:MAG: Mrp/NBP35 family ATP-binding protein [Christensenella sp.]|nr:Mrp/NBP35 family ATP-binding protein [Christensenella sp.]